MWPRVRAWLSHALALGTRRAAPSEACLWLAGIGPRPFVLGRGSTADLVVSGESVSRRHAQIVRTTDGYMLADLGSTNGTWLGGRRVGQVEIAGGDVIELATFRCDSSDPGAGPLTTREPPSASLQNAWYSVHYPALSCTIDRGRIAMCVALGGCAAGR